MSPTLQKTLSTAVGAYQKQLAASIDTAKKDVSDQIALLKTRDVTAAIGRSPDATKLAASLTKSLNDQTKARRRRRTASRSPLSQLAKDIDELNP